MDTYIIMILAAVILLPALGALLCRMAGRVLRSLVVILVSLILIAAILLLIDLLVKSGGHITVSIVNTGNIPSDIGWLIKFLDFALLVYVVYVGLILRKPVLLIITLLQLAALIVFDIFREAPETAEIFSTDCFSSVMMLVISAAGSAVTIFLLAGHHRYFISALLLTGAANGFIEANDLYWLYFFWLAMALCIYLISYGGSKGAFRTGTSALQINMAAGLVFAAGIIFVYNSTGTTALNLITGQFFRVLIRSLPAVELGFLTAAGIAGLRHMP